MVVWGYLHTFILGAFHPLVFHLIHFGKFLPINATKLVRFSFISKVCTVKSIRVLPISLYKCLNLEKECRYINRCTFSRFQSFFVQFRIIKSPKTHFFFADVVDVRNSHAILMTSALPSFVCAF